jgi:HNH endonuclease
MTSRPGRTDNTAWRRAKAQAIAYADGVCQLCGGALRPDAPKNTPWGTEVDHIRALAAGGAAYDLGNLRAVHRWCHQRRDRPLSAPVVPVAAVPGEWVPPDPWVPCATCPNPCSYSGRPASRCW